MTTAEKIEKAISLQRAIIGGGIEYRINGEWVIFSKPEESRKYQDIGKVRISDGKAFPASNHTRTSRERDAVAFLNIISDAIANDVFPEEDTRPAFKLQW